MTLADRSPQLPAVALFATSLILATSQASASPTQTSSPLDLLPLSTVARLERTFELDIDADHPLYSVYSAVVTQGRVFIPDIHANAVSVYDLLGSLIARFGREGQGPGEFVGPAALAVQGDGVVLVADAGNRRVQAFSAESYDYVRNYVTPWQNHTILPRPSTSPNDRGGFINLGLGNCRDGTTQICIGHEVGPAGEESHWGVAPPHYIASWLGASSTDGRLFIANVLGSSIEIYDRDRRRLRAIDLRSDFLTFFTEVTDVPIPRSGPDQRAVIHDIRTLRYDRIRGLVASNDYIAVQFERINVRPDPPPMLYMNLYDLEGKALHERLETPGLLRGFDGRAWYFVSDHEISSYGGGTVHVYVPDFPVAGGPTH